MIFQQAFDGGGTFSVQSDVPAGLYYMFVSDSEQLLYQGKMIINN